MGKGVSAGTVLLLLVSCAKPTEATTASNGAPPSSSEPSPPAQAPTATTGSCGGFEQIPSAAKTESLLDDRLLITPLEGMQNSAVPHNVMEAPPPSRQETRLMLSKGEAKLVVYTEELFARPGTDLTASVRSDERLGDTEIAEVTLPRGLRAAIATERKLEAPNEAVPVAHAFTVLPDDTIQVTHVFVNPAAISLGSAGCAALAKGLLNTLQAGNRRLELRGGERALGDFTMSFPEGYALLEQPGPDFAVYYGRSVRPLTAPPAEFGVYVGGHPDYEPDKAARKIPAKILKQSVTWEAREQNGTFTRQVLVPLGGQFVHVFFAAPTDAEAQELARAAESLKTKSR